MTQQIAEFSKTDSAIAELTVKYAALPDVNTKEGYDAIKKGIKEVDGYRTSLEKMRKELKDPILERGRLIDAEAKRITQALLDIAEPMKTAKKAVDEREKRMKEERIARLQAKVDELKAFPRRAMGKSSQEIDALISELGEIDTTHDFYDLTKEAIEAQKASMTELAQMLTAAISQEQQAEALAKQQAELDAEREQMERDRRELEELRAQQARAQKPAQEAPAPEQAPPAMERTAPAGMITPREQMIDAFVLQGLDDQSAAIAANAILENKIPFVSISVSRAA